MKPEPEPGPESLQHYGVYACMTSSFLWAARDGFDISDFRECIYGARNILLKYYYPEASSSPSSNITSFDSLSLYTQNPFNIHLIIIKMTSSSSKSTSTSSPKPYIALSAQKKAAQHSLIPKEWRLSTEKYQSMSNVMEVPLSCGLLDESEYQITSDYDATALLGLLKKGVFTAEQVTIAFCKRAAIAHQLVSLFVACSLKMSKILQCPMEKEN